MLSFWKKKCVCRKKKIKLYIQRNIGEIFLGDIPPMSIPECSASNRVAVVAICRAEWKRRGNRGEWSQNYEAQSRVMLRLVLKIDVCFSTLKKNIYGRFCFRDSRIKIIKMEGQNYFINEKSNLFLENILSPFLQWLWSGRQLIDESREHLYKQRQVGVGWVEGNQGGQQSRHVLGRGGWMCQEEVDWTHQLNFFLII